MTITPEFSTTGMVLAGLLAAYAAIGEPLLGHRMYDRLRQRRPHDPRALIRYYAETIAFWCVVAVLIGAAVAASPGLAAADVGLRLPDDLVFSVALAAAIVAVVVWVTIGLRRRARQGHPVPGLEKVEAMLPRTATERGMATAVAVLDGVVGEILYRGLLIAFGVGVLGLNLYVAAALALAVFALAGVYQGRTGVVAFALMGFAPTALYLLTGSLLLPIVFHTLLSLRDLVFLPAPEDTEPQPQAGAA
ncbi:CAAX prenyl protease-like protein [Murinocardiopsis flavida]|uniref:CAAX prenyl protease-like protein n=1 Tax=Murinocardiopsis flavida TaxID=645275 RepID=A0A2P8DGD7_9ACTN|nr:CPBP family glutamic-type intramembrane protease [Murinocardiopsis flavida]PSK96285.1 CAAX prenyl protease-like protein [Murinocardiopsis flavida]